MGILQANPWKPLYFRTALLFLLFHSPAPPPQTPQPVDDGHVLKDNVLCINFVVQTGRN